MCAMVVEILMNRVKEGQKDGMTKQGNTYYTGIKIKPDYQELDFNKIYIHVHFFALNGKKLMSWVYLFFVSWYDELHVLRQACIPIEEIKIFNM